MSIFSGSYLLGLYSETEMRFLCVYNVPSHLNQYRIPDRLDKLCRVRRMQRKELFDVLSLYYKEETLRNSKKDSLIYPLKTMQILH